jgi:hypothetical protein
MGAKKIQENKKNENLAHGVMICDVVPRKITKYGIPKFHRKTVHKKIAQNRTSLGFLPN